MSGAQSMAVNRGGGGGAAAAAGHRHRGALPDVLRLAPSHGDGRFLRCRCRASMAADCGAQDWLAMLYGFWSSFRNCPPHRGRSESWARNSEVCRMLPFLALNLDTAALTDFLNGQLLVRTW